MQTFLPHATYADSARVLDQKRLGKQRVETLQIMQVLLEERLVTSDKVAFLAKTRDKDGNVVHVERTRRVPRPKADWVRETMVPKGWSHHPAVLMWRGHELALLEYQKAVCAEWVARGYKDSCLEKTEFLLEPHMDKLSDERFHESHQSNLLRKDESYYSNYSHLGPDLPYKWPVTLSD
jgi:hypothetical protein